jgi:hypothetical protein
MKSPKRTRFFCFQGGPIWPCFGGANTKNGFFCAINRIWYLLKVTGATGSEVADTGYSRFTMLFKISSASDTVSTGLVWEVAIK